MVEQVVNKLILGTVQFGLDYGINNSSGKPDQNVVNEILAEAYKCGIRCLDTAEAYGTAHSAIGYFHRNNACQTFDIITKLPHNIDSSIGSKIEQYLVDLDVKSLYGLLFHSYETYKNNQSAFEELKSYKLSGKIKYFGVSVYTNAQIADVIADPLIDIIQLPFNLFDNINLRAQVLKAIKDSGKQAHTRSAFLQGLFFIDNVNNNKIATSLKPQLEVLQSISKRNKIPLQQLALNYCLQQPDIHNVLIGVDNLAQLKQNLKYAGELLSEYVLKEINQIKITEVNLLNPSLWNQ